MRSRPGGDQLFTDASSYVNGINAYIAQAQQPLNYLTMMPAEYAAIGQPQGPAPFTMENLVSIATLVGGIFGNGGGDQLYNATLYENMAQRFGPERSWWRGRRRRAPTAKKPSTRSTRRHRRKRKASTGATAQEDGQGPHGARRAAGCGPLRLCHVPQLR